MELLNSVERCFESDFYSFGVTAELVNSEVYDTNKIEGQWRQMKVSLPTHGREKEHYSYSSYLAEFIWRYINRGKDLFFVFLEKVASIYQFKD